MRDFKGGGEREQMGLVAYTGPLTGTGWADGVRGRGDQWWWWWWWEGGAGRGGRMGAVQQSCPFLFFFLPSLSF